MWRLYSSIRHRFFHKPLPSFLILAASFYILLYTVKHFSHEAPAVVEEPSKEKHSPDYDEAAALKPAAALSGNVELDSDCPALKAELGKSSAWNEFIEKMNAKQETFQSIAGSHIYVHSAYSDFRQPGKLRIVGIRSMSASLNLRCQLWYSTDKRTNQDKPSITPEKLLVRNGGDVQINNMPEGHGRAYVAAFYDCSNTFEILQDAKGAGTTLEPIAVSLVSKGDECKIPTNFIYLRSTKPKYDNIVSLSPNGAPPVGAERAAADISASKVVQHNFAVCVTPLNLAYNRVDQLVEMLEMNRVLGASHVVFYNNTIGPDVARALKLYINDGFVSLVQWQPPCRVHVWPVPPGYQEEIHYFGQIGSLNDCVMRTMSEYKYAVFTDLDEFAVPRQHANWHELRDDYFARNPAVAYTFRNTFFKLEWADDEEMAKNTTIKKYGLNSLLKLKREELISMPGSRSKLIVDPSMIDTIGIHQVWLFHARAHVFGGMASVVPIEVGLIHHYRNWETLGTDGQVSDRYMLKYADKLVQHVVMMRQRLERLTVSAEKG